MWGYIKEGCGFVVESVWVVMSFGVEIDLTSNTMRRKVSLTFFSIEKEYVVYMCNFVVNVMGKKGLICEVMI